MSKIQQYFHLDVLYSTRMGSKEGCCHKPSARTAAHDNSGLRTRAACSAHHAQHTMLSPGLQPVCTLSPTERRRKDLYDFHLVEFLVGLVCDCGQSGVLPTDASYAPDTPGGSLEPLQAMAIPSSQRTMQPGALCELLVLIASRSDTADHARSIKNPQVARADLLAKAHSSLHTGDPIRRRDPEHCKTFVILHWGVLDDFTGMLR
jgi:hypothetical protein